MVSGSKSTVIPSASVSLTHSAFAGTVFSNRRVVSAQKLKQKSGRALDVTAQCAGKQRCKRIEKGIRRSRREAYCRGVANWVQDLLGWGGEKGDSNCPLSLPPH